MPTLALEVVCADRVAGKPTNQCVKMVGAYPRHICETKDHAVDICGEIFYRAANGASDPRVVILVVYEVDWPASQSCSKAIILESGDDVYFLSHGPKRRIDRVGYQRFISEFEQ